MSRVDRPEVLSHAEAIVRVVRGWCHVAPALLSARGGLMRYLYRTAIEPFWGEEAHRASLAKEDTDLTELRRLADRGPGNPPA